MNQLRGLELHLGDIVDIRRVQRQTKDGIRWMTACIAPSKQKAIPELITEFEGDYEYLEERPFAFVHREQDKDVWVPPDLASGFGDCTGRVKGIAILSDKGWKAIKLEEV